MSRKPSGYWDKYEHCYEEAKKYKNRQDLKHGNNSAYNGARKHNWIDDYTWFVEQIKPSGYWTKERCLEIAQKCHTKAEFKKTNNGAYQASYYNHWLNDYIWFVDGRFYNDGDVNKPKNKTLIRKEHSLEIKNKYKICDNKTHLVYVYEFKEQNVAYVGLTMKRRLEDRDREHIFSNDVLSRYAKENNLQIPSITILIDNLTPSEAQIKEGEILNEYQERGWSMLNIAKTGSLGGFLCGKWNEKTCREEAMKYKTISEWIDKNQTSYNAARKNGWIDDYDWFEVKCKPNGYWNYDHCYEEAKKYTTIRDFRKNSQRTYLVARKNGWFKDYNWLKRLQKPGGYWNNYEVCFEEAKKYMSRIEFCKHNHLAYETASKNKWLNDYIWFVGKEQKPKNYWTKERCLEESKKYSKRADFSKGTPRAYENSRRNGWLDEFFPKNA